MFLLEVGRNVETSTVEKKLPTPNLEIDPRPILKDEDDIEYYDEMTFKISYLKGGRTASISRTDKDDGWLHGLLFRVYDPAKEVVPSFKSTTYTYLGVDRERAPYDTVVGIIDPSVRVIRVRAFWECKEMKICLMDDNVKVIEWEAFSDCGAMKTIRLSRNLEQIATKAFQRCASLDALFLSSSIEIIERFAFYDCESIRIMPLPPNINTERIGPRILDRCQTFFRTTQIQAYAFHDLLHMFDAQIHQSIIDFYQNCPPLHKICLNTHVTVQTINACIRTHGPIVTFFIDHDGMTPLHILAMNPHATPGTILTCFYLNMNAAGVKDHSEMTPIDYLWKYENMEGLISLVHALCIHREASLKGTSYSHQLGSKRKRIT